MNEDSEEFEDFLDELIRDITNIVDRCHFIPTKENIEQAYLDLYTKYRSEYFWEAKLDGDVIYMKGIAYVDPPGEWVTVHVLLPEDEIEID